MLQFKFTRTMDRKIILFVALTSTKGLDCKLVHASVKLSVCVLPACVCVCVCVCFALRLCTLTQVQLIPIKFSPKYVFQLVIEGSVELA